jgi:hypothetical protein
VTTHGAKPTEARAIGRRNRSLLRSDPLAIFATIGSSRAARAPTRSAASPPRRRSRRRPTRPRLGRVRHDVVDRDAAAWRWRPRRPAGDQSNAHGRSSAKAPAKARRKRRSLNERSVGTIPAPGIFDHMPPAPPPDDRKRVARPQTPRTFEGKARMRRMASADGSASDVTRPRRSCPIAPSKPSAVLAKGRDLELVLWERLFRVSPGLPSPARPVAGRTEQGSPGA